MGPHEPHGDAYQNSVAGKAAPEEDSNSMLIIRPPRNNPWTKEPHRIFDSHKVRMLRTSSWRIFSLILKTNEDKEFEGLSVPQKESLSQLFS